MNPKINTALVVVNVCATLFLAYFSFFAQPKPVYVNSIYLLNQYQGMVDARASFKEKTAAWKANIDTLSKEVETSITQFQIASPRMSAKERSIAEETLLAKQKQLSQYRLSMEAQAQQEDQQMTSTIVAEINDYLTHYAEAKGYKMILASTEYGNIAYAAESLNVTEDVLKGLNSQYRGK